jgi:hypothetical protein
MRHVTLFNELLTQLSKRLGEIRIEALWERLEAAEPPGTLIHTGEFPHQQDPPGVSPQQAERFLAQARQLPQVASMEPQDVKPDVKPAVHIT